MEYANSKVNALRSDSSRSRLCKYRDLTYGHVSWAYFLKAELIMTCFSGMHGALGLWFRSKLYPWLLGGVGRGVLFGRNVMLRQPMKITIGDYVIIDDDAVIDAKGETNAGIRIGANVFIGRNTVIYCKNGDIVLEEGVNISTHCTIFSSHKLTVRAGTVIGAYSYLLSGGDYDYKGKVPFAEQSGTQSAGELVVGPNSWIGAGVIVMDGAGIGEHCVIGGGAVVTRPIPSNSLAVGVPAKVVKAI